MDTYKLKFTRLQNEIFRLLSIKAGESLSQRQIAQNLDVSPTAVAKSLKDLKSDDLITCKKPTDMNLIQVSLNRDNPKAIAKKRIENLAQINKLIEYLEETHPGATIILFGSYSRGEDTMRSDIDIAVIGYRRKSLDLKRFETALERPINIQYYENLSQINKNLRANIYNGIVLSGAIDL